MGANRISDLCMNCFGVKGKYEVCPYCGYVEGTPPAQPHYLTPGTILGNHFIVGTVIGFGGFGITYKCFDTTLGLIVAAKEFYPAGLVNRSPGESQVGLLSGEKRGQYTEQLKRFLMEAQSVAQFGKAKDIVNVYDFFEENGTAYIIMEHIDGVLLKDYLEKQGAMEPGAALSVIMPIIQAVKKIHSKGIIHRDISPDNIFIASEETIKIFDFGAARLNDSTEGMAGEKVIKEGYSAPEQYRDAARQGFYSDIYSVGAIFYQMLTGKKPIESTEREFKDELKSPMELGAKISANMDRAVMEAMAVRPELRFQSIQQFEDALNNKRAAEYPKEKLKRKRRQRIWVIASSVLLVLAVGIAIGLYSTVLKPSNEIFDATVKKDTKITVWVENDSQKNWLDNLVNDGLKKSEDAQASESSGTGEDADKVEQMQKDDEKITVNVEVKPEMETALNDAKNNPEALPNMFLSDHVSNLSDYSLVSLEDNVYEALNMDAYRYMSEYANEFPGMKEMPTGLNTLLLYQVSIDWSDKNALAQEEFTDQKRKEGTVTENTVELKDLIAQPDQGYECQVPENSNDAAQGKNVLNPKWAYFDNNTIPLAMLLDREDWKNTLKKKEEPAADMQGDLLKVILFNRAAQNNLYMVNQKNNTGIYSNSIVADVTYRKKINDAVKSDTLNNEKAKGANPAKDYKTYVVTNEEKMPVVFSERFAIMGKATNSQKVACERLLWVALTQNGQDKKAANIDEMTYPILEDSLHKFKNYNGAFENFILLSDEKQECILGGSITGTFRGFASGLGGIENEQGLQEYCKSYVLSGSEAQEGEKEDETK